MRAHARKLGHRASAQRNCVPLAGLAATTALLLMGLFAGVAQASSVSNVTVDNATPSSAAGAKTVYTIGFTTSSTGGLSSAAGSQINITFPTGTDLTGLVGSSVKVPPSSSAIGNCFHGSGEVVTCTLFSGDSIAAGATVSVEVDGIVNASSTGSNPLSVDTTSDTSNSNTFTIANAQSLSVPTITNTTPSSAAGAKTVYTIGFTTSSTGGLSSAAGSQINITFPTGTDLTGLVGSSVKVPPSSSAIGNCFHGSGEVVTCTLFSGDSIAAGATVSVEVDGIVNASSTGSNPLSVDTTSDTSNSNTFTIANAQSLSVPTITNTTPSSAAGAKTVYTIGFTTSSTGGLSSAAGSQINITFPTGTDLTGLVGSSVKVPPSSSAIGNCFHGSGEVVTCTLFSGDSIAAGATVSVEVDGIVNASSTGSNPLSVDTTSDTSNSNTFTIANAQSLSVPTITNTTPSSAAGAKTVYTIGFTTSSTGGLSSAAGSQINITFPTGTDLTGLVGSSVKVPPSSSAIGNCFHGSGEVVTCTLFSGDSIAAGATVSVEVDGIVNASSTGSNPLSVDTTSDTSNSNTFTIAAGQLISQQTVTSSNSAAGATGVTFTIGFTTSSTGGLAAAAGSRISISFPATADLTHLTASSVADTTVSNSSIGNCFHGSGEVVTCTLFSGDSIGAGHRVSITVSGVTNPTPASDALTVSTTSDTGLGGAGGGGGGGSGGGGGGGSTGGGNPPPSPPAVTPSSPSTSSATSAAVSGTVNPRGRATTVVFQYGIDPSLRGPGAPTTLYDQSTAPQQLPADSSNHSVSANLTGLVADAKYHLRVVATNSAGTTNGPDQVFATPRAAPPPAPVLGQTQNAAPVSGKTFILVNGKFVALTSATKIKSGATIDALRGTLTLTSATGVGKKTQTGTFGGAVFKVTQTKGGKLKGLTTLTLVNNAFKGAPSSSVCTTKHPGRASAAALSKRTIQLLRGRDKHGKFRSKGRYAAATVRGTAWTIADRCDGTLTSVSQGSVTVNDLVRHVNVTVRAGHSYLAKARK